MNIKARINYMLIYLYCSVLGKQGRWAVLKNYRLYLIKKQQERFRKQRVNLAVVNKVRNKFSETFVREKVNMLEQQGYFVNYLYGETFPAQVEYFGHLVSNYPAILKFYELLGILRNKGCDYYLKKGFKAYLRKHKIKLVFAEFGTVGADVYSLCKELKIPLIITFRGHDINHKKIVETHSAQYNEMLQYACVVIGVSDAIIQKLKNTFSPVQDKLLYLPSEVNLELFKYSNHSENSPVFIAVGRFTEIKNPHLTILAFNEVLKEIPNAQLKMIGRGDLLESCVTLVQALNIQKQVQFLGVLSPTEIYAEMKTARVFVQHSLTTPINNDQEGTPVSVMEAMASGLPVIATKHAGITEIIQDGKNGILVAEYDYKAMAKEMIRICADDNLVATLGRNAADSILSNKLITQQREILVELVEKYRLK